MTTDHTETVVVKAINRLREFFSGTVMRPQM